MTRPNRAIAMQLGALIVLVGAAVTSTRWVPWLVRDPDVGAGLLVVGTFGIAVLALAVGVVWATVLSWLEYRGGSVQTLADRVTLFLGAMAGSGLLIYAFWFWGAL